MMQLLPIQQTLESNRQFILDADSKLIIEMTIGFYKKVGFVMPWIGYYVEDNGNLVGSAGFKGPPVDGIVEIAYGTNEQYQHQGIGTKICKLLVDTARQTDPAIKIIARTFAKDNYSASILTKNNFTCTGIVNDPDDGEVWEWSYSL